MVWLNHTTLLLVISLTFAPGYRNCGAHDVQKNTNHEFLGLDPDPHFAQQFPASGAVTETENQSWLSRLKDSIVTVVFGLVLMFFSIPVLWFGERRNAEMDSLTLTGEAACQTVSDKLAEDENRGRLVHIANAQLQSLGKVADKQFNVGFTCDCVRFRSDVQVFQHVEHEKKTEKEKIGGGKETVIEYSYTQEWRSESQGYLHNPAYKNTQPNGLDLGEMTKNCTMVGYGYSFELTDGLVSQCNNFKSAAQRIGDFAAHQSGYTFNTGGDSFFYFRESDPSWNGKGFPMIGDARVKFEYVPDERATVVALQVGGRVLGCEKDSFVPYRLINRGWFGISKEQEKELLTRQGKKTPKELADEGSIGGGICCICCCACNLVSMCFSALATPEIYHLFERDMSAAECFQEIKVRNQLATWIIRIVGWVMLFGGLYSVFAPIQVVLTVIPFLGPYLAAFADWLIYVFCLITTLIVASLIICLAYLRYRPTTALLYLAVAGFIVAATMAASNLYTKHMAN